MQTRRAEIETNIVDNGVKSRLSRRNNGSIVKNPYIAMQNPKNPIAAWRMESLKLRRKRKRPTKKRRTERWRYKGNANPRH